VGSKLVVDALEAVELGLQFGDGGGGWLSGEPALECLVEAFDLALVCLAFSGRLNCVISCCGLLV
jgi:hypothetical protein